MGEGKREKEKEVGEGRRVEREKEPPNAKAARGQKEADIF